MGEYRIVHLSDAHIGNPKWTTDAREVLNPILEDIHSQGQDFGLPHLIIVSGDLIFGFQDGNPKPLDEQIDEAKQWLRMLADVVGHKDKPIPLFIVPGNHDVNRDTVTRGDQLFTKQLDPQQVDDLLYKKDNTWRQLIRRLAEWKNFSVSTTSLVKVAWDSDWLSSYLIADHEGKRIGVAGINTSWSSFQNAETGKLWIGERQAQNAWNKLEGADFKIVVTHHPLSYLHPDERASLEMKIQAKFNLHLHGHDHLQWFIDARGHLKVCAGACYQDSRMPASYCWIGINCQEKKVRLRLRRWEPTGEGGWVAFHIPGKTDANGNAQTMLPFEGNGELTGKWQAPKIADAVTYADSSPTMVADGFTLCKFFRDRYSVRWESPSQTKEGNVNLVYWPVRLRYPNVVHAAQAFIAGGLQQKGAEVYLWLDDFGELDANAEIQFRKKVKVWIERVGGSGESINIQSMRKLLDTDQGRRIWETLKKWFAEQQTHRLGDVLRVSKLLGPHAPNPDQSTQILNELLQKSPKRLLNPPIVWTCLVDTLQRKSAGGVVTLGGIDEQPLWGAWRLCIGDASWQVGHVYVSTLFQGEEPFSMEVASSWGGIHNVEDALKDEFAKCGSGEKLLRDGGMAHWCFEHCASLPSSLTNSTSVPAWAEVKAKGPSEAIKLIPRAMEPWIF